ELSEADQGLLQNGLFIGRAINDNQAELGRGDFLIRGISGIDRENGALIVSDYLQSGETVQFHLRDANTAEEDLEMMLTPQLLYDPPAGAMLFSCNGRGTRLYPHPDGDISTIRKVVGDVDLAGFFCAGEIGPIGGRNFLHGHTASLALFRPLTDS
ncbi:MAG: FIST C-terminal domain-containing protein, partial [Anaerolineae bacterium]|nr:FIST C-terminal domain-containing protein [Anaerolineae bacterium]